MVSRVEFLTVVTFLLPVCLQGQAAPPQFVSDDLVALRGFFANLPPQVLAAIQAMESNLPPSSAQSIGIGGRLTSSLTKHYRLLPSGLEKSLSPLPAGYRRALIGGRVVILDARNVVRDMYFVPLPRQAAPKGRRPPAQ
ncbi:MAG: hypothetical protein HY858_06990 [Candidatus Solibacter usitatus]|nr:hypothetical protein [Candidatus Solibacter usitatus]